MILADLDRELAALVAERVACRALPPQSAGVSPGRTWRRAPDRNPASFATSIAFQLAALARTDPVAVAADFAGPLGVLPWIQAAAPSGTGYLTITVTARALGVAAGRFAAAGRAAAASTILASTTTAARPWPDPVAAPNWPCAWRRHTEAMTSRLASAAGATASANVIPERGTSGASQTPAAQPAVADAVAWFGANSVCYALARTTPGRLAHLGAMLRPGAPGPDPLDPLRQAHAQAASTLRWAADLHLDITEPGERAGDLLGLPAERELLGLLPWLPVRVAAAAATHRPDELPVYLEEVAAAWMTVSQTAPALPFGGRAAAADPQLRGARLMLARAAGSVLAAGLELTGAGWD